MKYSTLLLLFAGLWVAGFGQVPQAFKYQAVVRDATGGTVVNRVVSLRLSILESNPLGNAVYVEAHQLATNEFGLVSLEVGHGEPQSGIFESINWSSSDFYLKTELDLAGQGNYSFIGTTQLLSVPYALYAGKAVSALDDADKDPQNEIQDLNLSGNTLKVNNNPQATQINLSPYLDNTDNQTLSLNGNNLVISNGNSIPLPPDNDADTTNELQTLSLTGSRVLTISKGNSIQLASLADADPDPANELQNLTLNGNTLSISSGNSVQFPNDQDLSSTNELQILTISNDTIYLSQSNFVVLPKNLDNNPLNEIQTIHYKNDTILLSQSNFTVLPHDYDKDSANEIQNLQINDNNLSISKGNSIKLYNLHSFEFPQGVDGKLISFQTEFGYYIVPEDSILYIIQNWQNEIFNMSLGIYAAGDSIHKSVSTIGILKKSDPFIVPFKIKMKNGPLIFDVPEDKFLIIKSSTNYNTQIKRHYIIYPPSYHYQSNIGDEEVELTGYFISK